MASLLAKANSAVAFAASPRNWGYVVLVAGAGLAVGAANADGGFLLEYWMGGALTALVTWGLLGFIVPREPDGVGPLLRRIAICAGPLNLLLVDIAVFHASLPRGLVMAAHSLAAGGVAFGIVSLRLARLPAAIVRCASRTAASPATVLALATLWALLHIGMSGLRWWNLGQNTQDMAIHEQAVYNTLHGRFLSYSTDWRYCGRELCRFADHFEPALLVFVPLYLIWPTPLWFLVVQSGTLAAGAVAASKIARRFYCMAPAGVAFAAAYLSQRGLHEAAMREFHIGVLAAPLIMWAIWLAMEKRLAASAAVFVLAMACKESIPATVFMAGLFLAWRGQRRFGLGIAAVAAAWALIANGIIIPRCSPTGHSLYAGILSDPGLARVLTEPGIARTMYVLQRVDYLFDLCGPVAFMCLLAPAALAISAPELLLHLLSRNPMMTLMSSHYQVEITVGIIIGGIAGLTWLAAALGRRFAAGDMDGTRHLQRALLIGFTAASLCWFINTPHLMQHYAAAYWWRLPDCSTQGVHALLEHIPDEAPVAVGSGALASHLARRPRLVLDGDLRSPTLANLGKHLDVDFIMIADPTVTEAMAASLAARYGLRTIGGAGGHWLWKVPHTQGARGAARER